MELTLKLKLDGLTNDEKDALEYLIKSDKLIDKADIMLDKNEQLATLPKFLKDNGTTWTRGLVVRNWPPEKQKGKNKSEFKL